MAFSFLNPFRRRQPDRTQEAANRARDRAFELGEQARRQQQEMDRKDRVAINAHRKIAREQRAHDEMVLREIEGAEFPPEALTEEEAWARSGEWWSGFSSTYCTAIAYDAEDERLMIQYPDGSLYAYHPVSKSMALELYRAPSKGEWCWDNLRERGTVFGYKVPYELISGPSQRTLGVEARRWMRNEETRRKHGNIPPSGRDYLGNPFRPRDIR